MEILTVEKYRQPKYPNKQVVIENPAMLKTLPERWKGNLYVGVALSTLLMLTLTACGNKEIPPGNDPAVSEPTGTKTVEQQQGLVAPIFEHGSGRGSFGCVSVAPPSFLSEEEAFQVIQEEAGKYKVVFEKSALEIKQVGIPETKYYLRPENPDPGYKENGGVIDTSRRGDLPLDGYDAAKKVGYEFISTDDYEKWHVEQSVRSSVDDYDFLSTAKVLKKGMEEKTGEASVGIFYNPMMRLPQEEIKKAMGEDSWDAIGIKTKDMAKAELRKQVGDFMEWLKAQGII